MITPAQVIGENVKAAREARGMTAEAFSERVGEILGSAWPRQTVYLLEQGGRRFAAEEVVAIAIVLEVSIADLFTPSADVDQVQVGERSFPRERLLTIGEKDASLYEIARHTQALRRSFWDISNFINSQRIVINNIDLALLGKPAEYEQPKLPSTAGLSGQFDLGRDYERARGWYEAASESPPARVSAADGSLIDPEASLTEQAGGNE